MDIVAHTTRAPPHAIPPCSDQVSRHRVFALATLLFAVSAMASIAYCTSMSMPGIPMPGGWTLSAFWLRMCGQTRPHAAAAFVGMWLAMMAAMMMPSLVPMLWRFRQCVAAVCPACAGRLTLLAGVGYFLVWSFVGVFVYACGAALAVAALQSAAFARLLPLAAGIVVACAGIMQFSAWKAHHLAAYRDACRCSAASIAAARAALELGMRAGVHCACSSAGLTVAGIAFGMMDWRTMVCLTALLTAERIAPHGTRIAQAAGVLGIAAGLWAIASSLFNI